ncbi:uncharacterized protein LOC114322240 [Camellia sinensis]|uniref:uncharacterized protein LOC114322240 n=1 Tax=Camellia sinensis TaxID=4442 RepID=UPI001036E368|nr:uncharacterized protein LOC114322240 [Camellia sinensis]
MKFLKLDLKKWNLEVFGHLEDQKAKVVYALKVLDERKGAGVLSAADMSIREEVRKEFGHLARMEEISFRQKSRCLWLKDGDRNTEFFHRMANAHRRVNQIGRIRVNGVEYSTFEGVKDSIVGYYKHLFRNVGEWWRPGLDWVIFDVISEVDCTSLERPFSEEEVFTALHSMSGDKAPGPDEFTISVFQHCWGVVKTEVMAMFDQFHQTGEFEKSLNATFLALIPKKGGAEDI